jgi:hypothetical protein
MRIDIQHELMQLTVRCALQTIVDYLRMPYMNHPGKSSGLRKLRNFQMTPFQRLELEDDLRGQCAKHSYWILLALSNALANFEQMLTGHTYSSSYTALVYRDGR